MKPIILFRSDRNTREELSIAKKHFPCVESRMDCADNLVIGRYSVLPYYNEMERDLKIQGSRLLNSHLEHQYVANFDYYEDLEAFTPKTWFDPSHVPDESGPWVLKGRTNSRKFQWDRLMLAKTKADLIRIYLELLDDPTIGPQGVVIRKYIPLEVVQEAIAGPPFTNEHRLFFYKANLLSSGYYWSQSDRTAILDLEGHRFAQKIAVTIKDKVPFVVVDIARTQSGEWILIELNDGQMSGLSDNDPGDLYFNLKRVLETETENNRTQGNYLY